MLPWTYQFIDELLGSEQIRAASKFVPDSTPLDMATASTEGEGVDADRFRGLPTAAKYAWRWRAFN
jgi:hypothetical protein